MQRQPRMDCILAARAPIALVMWRASGWAHLMRWRVDEDVLEHGAWMRKRIVAHKSDISDDGDVCCIWLDGVFQPDEWAALNEPWGQPAGSGVCTEGRHSWEEGTPFSAGPRNGFCWKQWVAYSVVSRAPWLRPLWARDEVGALGGGFCFDNGDLACTLGNAHEIDACGRKLSLRALDGAYHLRDLRRGWSEDREALIDLSGRAIRAAGEVWLQGVLKKVSGVHGWTLRCLRLKWTDPGTPPIFRSKHRNVCEYSIAPPAGVARVLADVVWAEWGPRGQLLVATRSGRVQRWEVEGDGVVMRFEEDVAGLEPRQVETPGWARGWGERG